MSPVNSHERPPRKDLMMNGLRPSPLKISKESHFIQKPQRQGPVIIYTHSPKIIHTQARDFMALVQKLTGFSRSDEEVIEEAAVPSRPRKNKAKDNSFSSLEGNINVNMKLAANYRQEVDNDSSSALTDENGGFSVADGDVNNVSSSYVPTTVCPRNPFFADIPLFTPNSTDFFFSPRLVHKFADMGNLNSPSLLEFMKGLPDY